MIWMWLSLIISFLKWNNSYSDEKNESHSVCIWLSITMWTILLYYHANHCNQLLGLGKIGISEQCLHLIDYEMNNYVFLPCKSLQSLVMVKVGVFYSKYLFIPDWVTTMWIIITFYHANHRNRLLRLEYRDWF